jgi:heme-degrading monooxygenase HmoA
MFAVIFEVQPKPGRWDDYLGYAKLLKPELEKIDGFLDNERFASKRRDGWLVSLSTWRDEKALIRWRTHALHHEVQAKGRTEVFRDYHLRVGEITADTQLPGGDVLTQQRFDETATGAAKTATLTEMRLDQAGAETGAESATTDWDLFESITRPGIALLLNFWADADAARIWLARPSPALRQRTVRIIRDYGMFARAEAPQYYPPAAGTVSRER